GKGVLLAIEQRPGVADGDEVERMFSEFFACPHCGLSFPELSPPSFSFNSPLGMCVDCNGLGTRPEMDPDLVVPDPMKTIRDGAVEPWASSLERKGGWTFRMVEAMGQALKVDLDTPW